MWFLFSGGFGFWVLVFGFGFCLFSLGLVLRFGLLLVIDDFDGLVFRLGCFVWWGLI